MECKCGCEHVERDSDRDVRIVILQRGWVMIGEYKTDRKELSTLDNAFVIRTWGTTAGIGELIEGPLSTTKLDRCGHVEFHPLAEIANIKVRASKWSLK